MRAKDIMTTPVVTVSPGTSVKEVAALLLQNAISAVPVVDEHEELVGIVSEADLVPLETTPDPRSRILRIPRRAEPVPTTAAEVMTRAVVTLPEEVDASEVARLMLDKHVKRIPIVSGKRVVGIVARRDLLRVLARSDDEIRAEVEENLDDEILMLPRLDVDVTGGVVTLRGSADMTGWRFAELLARSVPGVIDVNVVEVNP
jgi:CBS domain-containing protein